MSKEEEMLVEIYERLAASGGFMCECGPAEDLGNGRVRRLNDCVWCRLSDRVG
jgi:hypothetical protein